LAPCKSQPSWFCAKIDMITVVRHGKDRSKSSWV
jgi:hypothetical protein